MRRTSDTERLGLALLAVALYGWTLGFDLIWDDRLLILWEQSPVQGSLGSIWSGSFPIGGDAYYRPLVLTSWWLEHRLAGDAPFLYHLTQLALYVLCCLAVHALARATAGDSPAGRRASLAAAALFVVHPAHVEVVAFVAARTDLLAALFSVLATLAAVRAARAGGRALVLIAGASGLALLCGLLSKEAALATPLLSWLAMRTVPT